MTNPMLQNLNQNRTIQMVQNLKAIGNPQMMLQQMPQYKQVMEYVNQNGGDPKTAFYKLASEMGVDPESILNQIRG